jgi:hypothetical protein
LFEGTELLRQIISPVSYEHQSIARIRNGIGRIVVIIIIGSRIQRILDLLN